MLKSLLTKLAHALAVSPFLATLSIWFTPLQDVILAQSSFFGILTVLIMIDLVMGIIKYVKLKKFSFRQLIIGLIVKVAVTFLGMIVFLMFSTLDDGPIIGWFLLVAKFTILLYPAGSVFSNMYVVSGGKFPPIKLMKYLEAFDQLSEPLMPKIEKAVDHVQTKKDKQALLQSRSTPPSDL